MSIFLTLLEPSFHRNVWDFSVVSSNEEKGKTNKHASAYTVKKVISATDFKPKYKMS